MRATSRSRPADPNAASPPWSPAPEPGSSGSPAPVLPSAWLPGEPASGIRLPGGLPDAPRIPGTFEGPDLTAPFAGRDVITQASFDLSAAPVPADYPPPEEQSSPAQSLFTPWTPPISDPPPNPEPDDSV
jgi:hypothetical protein